MEQNQIGLIGAMKMEVDAILQTMESKSSRTHGGMTFTKW